MPHARSSGLTFRQNPATHSGSRPQGGCVRPEYACLTNNTTISALTIADLYRCRWQVEIFFKWIKQHLRIKSFYGTSENAVKTQIWIAISAYVLVAILRKRLEINRDLYTILQILSISLFEKVPIYQSLTGTDHTFHGDYNANQLRIFDF